MIKWVSVQPRRVIEDILYTGKKPEYLKHPWALISICSYPGRKLIKSEKEENSLRSSGCNNGLTAYFGDLVVKSYYAMRDSYSEKQWHKIILFEEEMARGIINFINKINKMDIPVLVVHCHAGVSRSGAVGVFATRFLGLDEKLFREVHEKYISPNNHVYDTLCKVSHLKGKYDDFWKNPEKIINVWD